MRNPPLQALTLAPLETRVDLARRKDHQGMITHTGEGVDMGTTARSLLRELVLDVVVGRGAGAD